MRLLEALGFQRQKQEAASTIAARIPRMEPDMPTGAQHSLRLAAVYRAANIMATAMGQLAINVERQGSTVEKLPDLMRRPSLNLTRSEFIEQLTLSLALHGNAYILKTVKDGETLSLEPLPPIECTPLLNERTGVHTVAWRGKTYTSDRIQHLAMMRQPGQALGLGPIQACAAELGGALQVRDYASRWFASTGQPTGILTTDQEATADELTAMRNAWNYLDSDGKPLDSALNPSRIRALGKGVHYQPILINPRDAQWIESQQFNTLQIARIFGVPSSLMLTAPDGNAQSYSNVEQEWIAFVRFTLAGYVRKIEDALTECCPHGQTVRFNLESLLRSDTQTRYAAHRTAIEIGLYSPQYARQIEAIPDSAAPAATEKGAQ